MILNMITTGAMIRIGKTWGNLMVDLQATNLKLKDRSERILMETCAIARDDARTLLESAGGSVKVAIVMHRAHLSREDATARIQQAMYAFARACCLLANRNCGSGVSRNGGSVS
jgi:N-acetylmuramic acid 6-phosphate etherase